MYFYSKRIYFSSTIGVVFRSLRSSNCLIIKLFSEDDNVRTQNNNLQSVVFGSNNFDRI